MTQITAQSDVLKANAARGIDPKRADLFDRLESRIGAGNSTVGGNLNLGSITAPSTRSGVISATVPWLSGRNLGEYQADGWTLAPAVDRDSSVFQMFNANRHRLPGIVLGPQKCAAQPQRGAELSPAPSHALPGRVEELDMRFRRDSDGMLAPLALNRALSAGCRLQASCDLRESWGVRWKRTRRSLRQRQPGCAFGWNSEPRPPPDAALALPAENTHSTAYGIVPNGF